MFCKECGKEIKDKAVVCPHCGVPVVQAKKVPVVEEKKVVTHLVDAIIVTLFCCLPFGVAAIVYAAKASSRISQGDVEGAKAASRVAGIWIWCSVAVGALIWLPYVLILRWDDIMAWLN